MSTENDARATRAREKATAQLEHVMTRLDGGTHQDQLVNAQLQAMLSVSYQLAALTEAVDALRFDR